MSTVPMRKDVFVPTLRLALAQVNVTVGDLTGNAATIVAATADAQGRGADLVLFPEMALTGYPPEDLVLRSSFRHDSTRALTTLAATLADVGLAETAVICGYLDDEGGARNAAAFLYRGEIIARYFKHHLPNYGVFDERRYFTPGTELTIVRHLGVDIAMTICEDVWQDGGPIAIAAKAGAGLVVSINGSPYERHKDDLRLPLLRRRAREANAPIAYVNTVGGQDDLVFDGDSMVISTDGSVLMRAPQYQEQIFMIDVDLARATTAAAAAHAADTDAVADFDDVETAAAMTVRRVVTSGVQPAARRDPLPRTTATPLSDEAEVWGALVTGVRDYVRKNGFSSVTLGLSGGIDSAVVAAIAADAIGGKNVFGVSLPSEYSSDHSKSDAADLAERIGASYRVVPIAPMVNIFVASLSLSGLAEENVQARVRGVSLMAISNVEGHLVLATGNKSELAVGYSTIYGDAVGGFAPIKDVPKTLVWTLARWRNAAAEQRGETPPIPLNSIEKAPSAELRPGQLDSDSLPDYELLDAIIERYVDGDQDVAAIVAAGFDEAQVQRVARLINRAEWKRRQYPPGTKISFKSFGKDRRLPITNRWPGAR